LPVRKATKALANAALHRKLGQFRKARYSMLSLSIWLQRAHKAGMAQIGAPPTDPESDIPPGPDSVIAVFALEHAVVVRVTAMTDRLTVGIRVKAVLYDATSLRTIMMTKVVNLVLKDPEGAGGDYSDGMTDTVPIYPAEVTAVKKELTTGSLTTTNRQTLTVVLARSKATVTLVNKGFGGGE
jgi:hypothetical protein